MAVSFTIKRSTFILVVAFDLYCDYDKLPSADQDRCTLPLRALGQVQPAAQVS